MIKKRLAFAVATAALALAAATATALPSAAWAPSSSPVTTLAPGSILDASQIRPDNSVATLSVRHASGTDTVVGFDQAPFGQYGSERLLPNPVGVSGAISIGRITMVSDAQGNLFAAWTFFNASTAGIAGSYRPVGGEWSAPTVEPGSSDVAHSYGPLAVATDNPGSFLVSFLRATDIPAIGRFTAAAGWAAGTADLSSVPAWVTPVLAGTSGGIAMVAWVEAPTPGTVKRLMARPTGLGVVTPVELARADSAAGESLLAVPSISVGPSGTATVVYGRNGSVFARDWSAAGGFGAPQTITSFSAIAVVAGRSIVVFPTPGAAGAVQISTHAADNTWSQPVPVAGTASRPGWSASLYSTKAAVKADGGAIVATSLVDRRPTPPAPTPADALVVDVPADGSPASATIARSSADDLISLNISANAQGNFVLSANPGSVEPGWTAFGDGNDPVLGTVTMPGTLGAGQIGSFTAAATDAGIGVREIRWSFGDGQRATAAPGQTITHTYGAAGTFTVTVDAVDGLDHIVSRTGTVTVAAAPGTPAPPRIPALLRKRQITLDLDLRMTASARSCPVPGKLGLTVSPGRGLRVLTPLRGVRITRVPGARTCRVTGTVRLNRIPTAGEAKRLRITAPGAVTRSVRVARPVRIPALLRGQQITLNLDMRMSPAARACPTRGTFRATVLPAGGPGVITPVQTIRIGRTAGTRTCRITGSIRLSRVPRAGEVTTLRLTAPGVTARSVPVKRSALG